MHAHIYKTKEEAQETLIRLKITKHKALKIEKGTILFGDADA
jgi:hypothetical protein